MFMSMQYTEEQIEQYLSDYILANKKDIKKRLRFLIDNWKIEDQVTSPDVSYCLEEAKHAFRMGCFVASIIMSAVTIERHLARLLGLPFHAPVDEKTSLEGVGEKVIKSAKQKKIIDENLSKKLLLLNKMRNDFVHGINSEEHKRPQKKDPIRNTFMWTYQPDAKEIKKNAEKSIKILFEAMEKLHYTKLSYY